MSPHRGTLLVGLALLISTTASAQKPAGKGPCSDGSQCKGGMCLAINAQRYCSQPCGSCPAGMYCDHEIFQMLGLQICVKGSLSQKPQPQQMPPRLPCRTDAQCPPDLVCAEMLGQRDCTIECQTDSQCDMPPMMGVKFDFLNCGPDESRAGRRACLPRGACISDPRSCINASRQDLSATKSEDAPSPNMAKAINTEQFQGLLQRLKQAPFDDERSDILKSVANRHSFTCQQVGKVLKALKFGDERVGAVRILAPHIIDPNNRDTVLKHLPFDDEKRQVRKILDAR